MDRGEFLFAVIQWRNPTVLTPLLLRDPGNQVAETAADDVDAGPTWPYTGV
jgi:hypothetical protein